MVNTIKKMQYFKKKANILFLSYKKFEINEIINIFKELI